jgi:hypothetical protein
MTVNTPMYPRVPLGVLADGTPVRVRSWVDGSWMDGFEIVGIVAEDNDMLGYRVAACRMGTSCVGGFRPTRWCPSSEDLRADRTGGARWSPSSSRGWRDRRDVTL